MNREINHMDSTRDDFEKLYFEPTLYGSLSDFRLAIERFNNALSNSVISLDRSLKIRLALLWARMARGNIDCNRAISELENIAMVMSGQDELLDIEYRIVKATCMILLQNDYSNARLELEKLSERLASPRHNFLYGLVARALCNVNIMLGSLDEAEEYAQDAVSIFRRIDNRYLLALSLNSYAVMKKMRCQYEEAEKLLKRAMKIFHALGATDGEFLCLMNLAIVKMKTGDWASAEHYHKKLCVLESNLEIEGNNLLMYKINVARQQLMQRHFSKAEHLLAELAADDTKGSASLRRLVLAHEFLGELYIETMNHSSAFEHLEKASILAAKIAPGSDLMTELRRRRAQLFLSKGDFEEALGEALECIRLCRRNGDKHELGACLRILAELYSVSGAQRKARSSFEASINILKDIHECYELMRTCLSYGRYLVKDGLREAEIYLLEARHLADKLNLPYYKSLTLIAMGRYAMHCGYFSEAGAYLRKSEEAAEELEKCDRRRVASLIQVLHRELDRSLLKASMQSAQKLKALGKIFEEARFPMEECSQEMALEVARNVGASKLFLVRKRNGGYVIPIRYNITYENARRIARNCDDGATRNMFKRKSPSIYKLEKNRKLLCVPGEGDNPYVLCSIVGGEKIFSKKDIEFLIASAEAMEKIAEESSIGKGVKTGSDVTFDLSEDSTRPGGSFREIITRDPEIIKLIKLADRAAKTDVPVLLQGETGVGKELFARAIHDSSIRGEKGFIAINTGGIPLNFLESELFGYIKGAYTGARMDRMGLIEEACGGTLFLDEVAEMSEELQVKLLRLLENGEFRRLGENKLRHSDVRVISATNKDLDLLVKQGKFRKDLYYRLSTVRFNIPALRFRKDDVELLVRHFIALSSRKLGKIDGTIDVDVKAMEALELYNWPGNVRELQNEIMRIISLMGEERIIRFAMLSDSIRNYFRAGRVSSLLEKNVERFERRLILKALDENDWNRVKTAERIGVPRSTLLAKMRRLNILS